MGGSLAVKKGKQMIKKGSFYKNEYKWVYLTIKSRWPGKVLHRECLVMIILNMGV